MTAEAERAEWAAHERRERDRYDDGERRLGEIADADARQRQLTRMANAAYGAGLSLLMVNRRSEASEWLRRAAERYRETFADAPSGSWGRPIGALKARLLARDREGALADARWTLESGAAASDSPIGRYAAALAYVVLEEYEDARIHADAIRLDDDFPAPVGDALAYICAEDVLGYVEAIEAVLESFETRDEYLEDVPVADTVLVLQALAARRGVEAELSSPLLPR